MMNGRNLDELPTEILFTVLEYLPESAILSISLTTWRLRLLSLPTLFRTLRISFSILGLERLSKVSRSHISMYVKILCYEASEIIDPCK